MAAARRGACVSIARARRLFFSCAVARSTERAASEDDARGSPSFAIPDGAPFFLGKTDASGRGLFASRAIARGELILRAPPLVAHPALDAIADVCYACLRRIPSATAQTRGDGRGLRVVRGDDGRGQVSRVFGERETAAAVVAAAAESGRRRRRRGRRRRR